MTTNKSYTDPTLWPRLREKAREFRETPTSAEGILWEKIRGGKFTGKKFRRQHPIGRFIVDFCCPQANLVIELDGPVHRNRVTEDADRQDGIEARGFKVIRFSNAQVSENLEAVLEEITRILSAS